jgi:hypothetical protein
MTDTQMVIVPKNLSIKMINQAAGETVENTQIMGEFQDIHCGLIQASPNQGKVTPEMVEAIVFNVRKIAIENDLEKHKKLYNSSDAALFRIENGLRSDKDFNNLMERMVKSVLKTLGLEVSDG